MAVMILLPILFFTVLVMLYIAVSSYVILLSPLFIYLAILPFTNRWGVEFDLDNKGIREFTSIGFIKRGKWKNLTAYPDISILSYIEGVQMSNFIQINTYKNRVTSVYLLTSSHRRKIEIQKFDDSKAALSFGKSLSKKLNKPFVKYSPTRR